MTDDEQLAESIKYSSAHVWHFAELRPGVFALYNHERKLQLITANLQMLITAYQARPAYVPPKRERLFKGIDLSDLKIQL